MAKPAVRGHSRAAATAATTSARLCWRLGVIERAGHHQMASWYASAPPTTAPVALLHCSAVVPPGHTWDREFDWESMDAQGLAARFLGMAPAAKCLHSAPVRLQRWKQQQWTQPRMAGAEMHDRSMGMQASGGPPQWWRISAQASAACLHHAAQTVAGPAWRGPGQ